MQPGPHNSRRCVRIAAIALVILGALALGNDHARAQLGLDTLRAVVDKAKGQGLPGKDVLKGKSAPNLKGQVQKGQGAKDAISNATKNKGALEKFTKGPLTKDKAKDLIARDKLKDKFGKGTDRQGQADKDRLTKIGSPRQAGQGQAGGKDQLAKDKLRQGPARPRTS